jgi:hypothetical protein
VKPTPLLSYNSVDPVLVRITILKDEIDVSDGRVVEKVYHCDGQSVLRCDI